MKARLSAVFILVGLTLLLAGAATAQKTEPQARAQSIQHFANRMEYYLDCQNTAGLGYTSNITSTIYLPFIQRGTGIAKIAFTSRRDGNAEIYVMNPDGTDQTRLTDNPTDDHTPAWSPEGTRIAFVRKCLERSQSPVHGNALGRLLVKSGSDFYDAIQTAKHSLFAPESRNSEIYVMNADGTGQTRLTKNSMLDANPAWSPDGTRITFVSDRDDNPEIYVMNADGTGQTRLTNNSVGDWGPNWSPDGTRIAFYSYRDGKPDIYVMNADGTGQIRLTNDSAGDYVPDWSPDGTKIAFFSTREGGAEIYVMNADGTGQTRLTNSSIMLNANPAWSPDGARIAFDSCSWGNETYEIYVMNADGTGQTRLTNNSASDWAPDW